MRCSTPIRCRLTNQLTFYVQVSRARGEVTVLTDDAERLVETLEAQSGERASAHEALGWTPEPGAGVAARARRRGYERMRRDWRRVRQRARGRLPMAADAAGYAAVHRQVEALRTEPALAGYLRDFVDEWLGEHARSTARQRAVEAVVEGAARLAALPGGEGAAGDESVPALLERAREIHEDEGGYGAHLEALEGGRARFERAAAALWEAAFVRTERAVAREAGALAFYAPGHGALVACAGDPLRWVLPVDEALGERAVAVLRTHAQRVDERHALDEWLLTASGRAPGRERGQPFDPLDRWLLERGRTLYADAGGHAAHLSADRALGARFAAALAALEADGFREARASTGWEANQRATVPFYAPAHPRLLAHAGALARSALPLPEAVRAQARTVVADAARRREERRTLGAYLAEAGLRAATLGQGGAWRARDRTLLGFARAMGAKGARFAPHLRADAALRARFEAAAAALEAGGFGAAEAAVAREADAAGTMTFYAPSYPALVEHARALQASALPLPEAVRERAGEAVARHVARDEERATLDAVLDEAGRREAKRSHGRWGWRDHGLLARMRSITASEDAYGAHLAAAPALRERFERARAQLEAGAFVHALDTLGKKAHKRGTAAFHVRGYERVVAQAAELAASPLPLPEAVRARAREAVAEDEQQRLKFAEAGRRARRAGEAPDRPTAPAAPGRRERLRDTQKTLRALCAESHRLASEAASLGETLERGARTKRRARGMRTARRAFRERRDAWWARVDGALAAAKDLLGSEETAGSPLDPLRDARAAMAHDVRELERLARVAPMAAGSLALWRTHVANARAAGEHPFARDGHDLVYRDLERVAAGHAPGSAVREALEAEVREYAAWTRERGARRPGERSPGVGEPPRGDGAVRAVADTAPPGDGREGLVPTVESPEPKAARRGRAERLVRERRGHGLGAGDCAAHSAFDAPWYAPYIARVGDLCAEKAPEAEVPPELARDLEEHGKREGVRRMREALRELHETALALLEEAEGRDETLARGDRATLRARLAVGRRRAFAAHREAWWERLERTLAPANAMLADEAAYAVHLDTLEHARAPMRRDAEELALLARVAPVPAGPLRRWRLHAAGARERGVHPFRHEGCAAVHEDLRRAAAELDPGAEAWEALEAHLLEYRRWEAARRHAERAASVERTLVALRAHVAARLRAARRGAAPVPPAAPTAQQAGAARAHAERVLGEERAACARVLEAHPRWEKRLRDACARFDELPRLERLHGAWQSLRHTLAEGARLLREAERAGEPTPGADAHRDWCTRAQTVDARTQRVWREDGAHGVRRRPWPWLEQRLARDREAMRALLDALEVWVDWGALRRTVAAGAALDREALGTGAPARCSERYRQWDAHSAEWWERTIARRLRDDAGRRRTLEARPGWASGLREALERLARLRERHRLCALAADLSDSVRSREALEADSRQSGAPVTALPGHARQASDADARGEAARRVLGASDGRLRRRLVELPGLERQMWEDLATLDAYRQRDAREEAQRRQRARSRGRSSGRGMGR